MQRHVTTMTSSRKKAYIQSRICYVSWSWTSRCRTSGNLRSLHILIKHWINLLFRHRKKYQNWQIFKQYILNQQITEHICKSGSVGSDTRMEFLLYYNKYWARFQCYLHSSYKIVIINHRKLKNMHKILETMV